MNVVIGPYKLMQRTPHSKIRITYINGNEIEDDKESLIDEITKDYVRQIYEDDFFEMNGDHLIGIKQGNDNVKYLFIPEGITVIKNKALAGKKFEYISLPNTLEKIEEYAFQRNGNLKYIDIPETVNEIGVGAFMNCYLLSHVTLPQTNILRGKLFHSCTSLKTITIPNSVITIENSVFYNCSSLSNIQLSRNLKVVGSGAFARCSNLKKIDLPDSLEMIKGAAFDSCLGLKELIIPDNVNYISDRVFANCKNLEYVKLPNNIKFLQEKMFLYCDNLKTVTLPDTICDFGEKLFKGTFCLKNVNIPKDLSSLSNPIFDDSSVESLTFNHSLKSLTMYGYELLSFSNIRKIIINENVKKIIPEAFKRHGKQITDIEYNGTKTGFEEFKKNNKKLLECFPNAKISLIEKSFKDPVKDDLVR